MFPQIAVTMEIQLLPGHEAALNDFFHAHGQRLKLDPNLVRVSILGLMVLAYQKHLIVWLPYSKLERFPQVNGIFLEKIKSVYLNERKYIIDDDILELAIKDFASFIDHMHTELQKKPKR
jgi:hypothetical protein